MHGPRDKRRHSALSIQGWRARASSHNKKRYRTVRSLIKRGKQRIDHHRYPEDGCEGLAITPINSPRQSRDLSQQQSKNQNSNPTRISQGIKEGVMWGTDKFSLQVGHKVSQRKTISVTEQTTGDTTVYGVPNGQPPQCPERHSFFVHLRVRRIVGCKILINGREHPANQSCC